MKPILYGLLFGGLIGLAISSLIAGVDFFRGRRIPTDQLMIAVVAAFAISFIICGALGSFFTLSYVVREHLLRRGGGNIYAGRHGLYYSGEFWPSGGVNPRFLGIRRDAGPPTALVFEFHIKTPRRGSYDHQVRVPIPPGREAEAQYTVEQVRAAWGLPAG